MSHDDEMERRAASTLGGSDPAPHDGLAVHGARVTVVNVSKTAPGTFSWFDGQLDPSLGVRFEHVHAGPANAVERTVRRPNLALHRACLQAAAHVASGRADLMVTHLPVVTMYTGLYARPCSRRVPHVAFAFNHAPLPSGLRNRLMRQGIRDVDRFVVFSTVERELYAETLGIPIDRIDMIHWGVQRPVADPTSRPPVGGDYLCAVGSSGRHYGELLDAMAALAHRQAVVVTSPGALRGLAVPPNVTVLTEVTQAQVAEVIHHSRFMVLPLEPSPVPYGHGTAVMAMRLGRAVLVTDTSGMDDYITPVTGRRFDAGHPGRLAEQIEDLWTDDCQREEVAAGALEFVERCCTEERTRHYVEGLIADLTGGARDVTGPPTGRATITGWSTTGS